MKRSAVIGFVGALLMLVALPLRAQDGEKTLETKFTTIRYASEEELTGFLWRISGQRITGEAALNLATNRVDEIVERVETLLDMYPEDFHFDLLLEPRYEGGEIAYYREATRSVTVAVDRVTDGVFAHEVAHAVITASFEVAPPEKAQEILARYVDQHLWSDPV